MSTTRRMCEMGHTNTHSLSHHSAGVLPIMLPAAFRQQSVSRTETVFPLTDWAYQRTCATDAGAAART
eukprot:3798907-Karenia_brevis.AAC.1